MRAALVLALLLAGTAAIVAVPAPAAAMPTCSPVYALEQGAPDAAVECIQRNMSPCHYAYPHPCE